MRTLVLTCNTGEGHNSTARAILEFFENKGEFCIINEAFSFLSRRLSRMIGKGHATMYRHTPKVFNTGYAITEKKDNAFARGSIVQRFFSHGSKKLYKFVVDNNIDNIICVHPFSAVFAKDMCSRFKLDNITLSIVATDYTCAPGTNSAEMDFYFAPHDNVVKDFINNGIPKEKIIVSGIPVKSAFYQPSTKSEAKERLNLPKDKKIILMCCGSMGCGPIEKIAKKIYSMLESDEMLVVVCGSNKKLYNNLCEFSGEPDKIRVVGYTTEMRDYMSCANLFITKPGGISTTESSNLRTPMVFVNAVAGCELRNREFFNKIGGAILTENSDDVVEKSLRAIKDENALEKMSEILCSQFTYSGADIIYQTLYKNANLTDDLFYPS